MQNRTEKAKRPSSPPLSWRQDQLCVSHSSWALDRHVRSLQKCPWHLALCLSTFTVRTFFLMSHLKPSLLSRKPFSISHSWENMKNHFFSLPLWVFFRLQSYHYSSHRFSPLVLNWKSWSCPWYFSQPLLTLIALLWIVSSYPQLSSCAASDPARRSSSDSLPEPAAVRVTSRISQMKEVFCSIAVSWSLITPSPLCL